MKRMLRPEGAPRSVCSPLDAQRRSRLGDRLRLRLGGRRGGGLTDRVRLCHRLRAWEIDRVVVAAPADDRDAWQRNVERRCDEFLES